MTDYQRYRAMPWTSDADECEAACGVTMCETHYVEGVLGHYCSEACRNVEESGGAEPSRREDFHADD